MQKFFLTFKSKELEKQYQHDQLAQIKKPVYLFMIFVSLCINIGVVIYAYFSTPIETWYLNVTFAIFSFLQIIVIIILKKLQYLQLALTLTNITFGFLQLDVDPATTTQTEYYSYGNVFMQVQVILYFISDFPHAIIQIVSHIITRTTLTVIVSQHIDYVVILGGVVASIFVLLTMYVKDENQRRYYLLNLKDNYVNDLTSFLIDQPFIKFSLTNQMMFDVTQHHLIEKFPGYENDICAGCNARSILRNYYCEQKKNLEQILLKNGTLKLPGIFQVNYQNKKYKIKLCKTDVCQLSYMVILQQICFKSEHLDIIKAEEIKLKQFLQQNYHFFQQKIFDWGVLSVILLQTRIIKQIDFNKLLNKLLLLYANKIFKNILVKILSDDHQSTLITYPNQLKIFLIQFFNIIVKIQKQKRNVVQITLRNNQNDIHLIINVEKSEEFIQLLYDNYFIRQTMKLLTENNKFADRIIILCFKNYPLGSYIIS